MIWGEINAVKYFRIILLILINQYKEYNEEFSLTLFETTYNTSGDGNTISKVFCG